jgi:hypothetical protein
MNTCVCNRGHVINLLHTPKQVVFIVLYIYIIVELKCRFFIIFFFVSRTVSPNPFGVFFFLLFRIFLNKQRQD